MEIIDKYSGIRAGLGVLFCSFFIWLYSAESDSMTFVYAITGTSICVGVFIYRLIVFLLNKDRWGTEAKRLES